MTEQTDYEALGLYTKHSREAFKLSKQIEERLAKLARVHRNATRSMGLVASFDAEGLEQTTKEVVQLNKELEETLNTANHYAIAAQEPHLQRAGEIG